MHNGWIWGAVKGGGATDVNDGVNESDVIIGLYSSNNY